VAGPEVGSRGIGRHSLEPAEGMRLTLGVNMLRLTQGPDARMRRVAIID
jgi:hypothetical protein